MKRLVFCFFVLFCVCFPLQAARKALVIGNGCYHDSPLKNPENDARLIASTLRDLDFTVFDYYNLNGEEFERNINHFATNINLGDEVFFYYSGHAMQIDGENYLIPVRENINDIFQAKRKTINLGLITDYFTKAGLSIVVLDACRNNPFAFARSANKGLALTQTNLQNVYIVYSTSPGDVAEDGYGKNSTFTESLSRHMLSPNKSFDEVMNGVTEDLATYTQNKQRPWKVASATKPYYLMRDESMISNEETAYPVQIAKTENYHAGPNLPAQIETTEIYYTEPTPLDRPDYLPHDYMRILHYGDKKKHLFQFNLDAEYPPQAHFRKQYNDMMVRAKLGMSYSFKEIMDFELHTDFTKAGTVDDPILQIYGVYSYNLGESLQNRLSFRYGIGCLNHPIFAEIYDDKSKSKAYTGEVFSNDFLTSHLTGRFIHFQRGKHLGIDADLTGVLGNNWHYQSSNKNDDDNDWEAFYDHDIDYLYCYNRFEANAFYTNLQELDIHYYAHRANDLEQFTLLPPGAKHIVRLNITELHVDSNHEKHNKSFFGAKGSYLREILPNMQIGARFTLLSKKRNEASFWSDEHSWVFSDTTLVEMSLMSNNGFDDVSYWLNKGYHYQQKIGVHYDQIFIDNPQHLVYSDISSDFYHGTKGGAQLQSTVKVNYQYNLNKFSKINAHLGYLTDYHKSAISAYLSASLRLY